MSAARSSSSAVGGSLPVVLSASALRHDMMVRMSSYAYELPTPFEAALFPLAAFALAALHFSRQRHFSSKACREEWIYSGRLMSPFSRSSFFAVRYSAGTSLMRVPVTTSSLSSCLAADRAAYEANS